MNWTWQEVAAFCAFLGFIWAAISKISRALKTQAQAIRESAIAQAEAQAKSKADKQRTEALWGIVELQGELIAEIQDHLTKPPGEREITEFHVRRTTTNLKKKATDRLNSLHTDFT